MFPRSSARISRWSFKAPPHGGARIRNASRVPAMMRDGHVRVLPVHVANKIAAGEVVERPSSVVKELVENAIDAGAKTIKISIVQGGRKYIAVQDDGCGMTRDDAVLCLERQATSKISDVDDIEEIDTLGFRGEAIPSIASVSRFSLVTRRRDADEGTYVEVNAGTLACVRAAGCPPGTLVEVRDLFCNVPARRKFLKTAVTEEGHVKAIFTVNALAHPAIALALSVDGREIYKLAAAASPLVRIRELFGAAFAEALATVDYIADKAAVSGFIERPNRSFPTRREQYIFINGRPASAPCVAQALRDAYPRGDAQARPAAILFISVPPRDLDVNVHPTKHEVRFRDTVAVRHAITEAISAAIGVESAANDPSNETHHAPPAPAPSPAQPAPAPSVPAPSVPAPVPRPAMVAPSVPRAAASAQAAGAESVPVWRPSREGDGGSARIQSAPIVQNLPLASASGMKAQPWTRFRYLCTTEPGYILIETDSGIVTINPAAARERIAFERLLAAGARDEVQEFLIPETVQLPPAAAHRIVAFMDVIAEMGFRLEEFGQGVFKVEAVPRILGKIPPADILATVADALAQNSSSRAGAKWREDIVAKSIARACAGEEQGLDAHAATALVNELVACRMPYVTPRGRNIMIFTSFRELDRKFGRI